MYQFHLIHSCREGDSNKSSKNVELRTGFDKAGFAKVRAAYNRETAWARRNFGPGVISPKHSYQIVVADKETQKTIAYIDDDSDAHIALNEGPEELYRRHQAIAAQMESEYDI